MDERSYIFSFREQFKNRCLFDIVDQLGETLARILDEVIRDYHKLDIARLHIIHPDLRHRLVIPAQSLEEFNADMILDLIEEANIGLKGLNIASDLLIQLGISKIESGGDSALPGLFQCLSHIFP